MSNLGGVASVLDYCQFYHLFATHYFIIIFKSMNILSSREMVNFPYSHYLSQY